MPAPGASAAAQAAVRAVCSQIGVWYTWGGGHGATPGPTYGYYDGSDPASKDDGSRYGFDCSGLTRYAYYEATGRDILDGTASDQYHSSLAVQRFSAAQGDGPLLPGDLMFWGSGYIRHVAMYIGAGQMGEAYESGTHIRQAAVRTGGDYAGAIRLAATPGNPTPPPAGGGSVFQTWGTDVRTHSSPSTTSSVVHTFSGPTQVGVVCQEHAETVTAEGYTNDVWSKLSNGSWMTNIYKHTRHGLRRLPAARRDDRRQPVLAQRQDRRRTVGLDGQLLRQEPHQLDRRLAAVHLTRPDQSRPELTGLDFAGPELTGRASPDLVGPHPVFVLDHIPICRRSKKGQPVTISKTRKPLGAAFAATVLVACLGVAAAPSAQAAGAPLPQALSGDFTATGVRIHTDSDTGSPALGEGNPGDGLTFWQATEGEYNPACGNDQWAQITDNRTYVKGWVSVRHIHVNG
ncbi:NlpC/P60 family protein [Streptomyces sp. ICBB 8177]|uniref:C40 family peptidase n=1 Tax=Streptomyces sp. ICBB 8177 TaxID=563922 RepID=UPI0026B3FBEE